MRKQFELTDEQWNELSSKVNPVDLYESWSKIGRAQGFDWMTVTPVVGHNRKIFTAEEWDGTIKVGKL